METETTDDILDLTSPHKFFSLQKRYIDHVKETVKENKILLIEAGTGFGKTLTNLYAALVSSRSQIAYLSKTHQQNEQVIHELENINLVNPKNIVTGLQLASRKQLCHIDHVADAFPVAAISMCMQYQKLRKRDKKYSSCISCTEKSEKIPMPVILTIESLRNLALKYNGCAYLTARSLIKDFDIITGHYNYYLSADIRRAVGTDETNPILILDEGHNLEEVLTSQYSATLSQYTITMAIKEVKPVDYQAFNLVEFLSNSIAHLVQTHGEVGDSVIFEGIEMMNMFASFGINRNRINKLKKRLDKIGEAINEYQKKETGRYQNQLAIYELLDFLEVINSPRDFGYIITKLTKGFRFRKECLNPAIAFQDVRKLAKSMIICSGTLSPLSLWKEILKIDEKDLVTAKYGSLTDPRRVKVVAFASDKYGNKLTTKYSHRVNTPTVYLHYLESLLELIKIKFAGGILVFSPSYKFIEKIQLPRMIGDVTCFQEDQDATKNSKLVQKYRSRIQSGKRALFMGVLGGKMSEGTDLPHDLVRVVIIIGIPYPPPKDPVIQLKRGFYDGMRNGLGTDWYNAIAFRKISQAIGRGWRTATDYSIGILLEERLTYSSSINKLPLWIKNSLTVANSWNDGINKVVQFHETLQKLN